LKLAPVIGFAGMSHLGLVSSVASAEKGFHVICFDPDAGRIEALRRQELPVSEPDLQELFSKNQERLTFTENVDDLNKCHVVYIAQDVPTDDQGQSDIGPIAALIEMVEQALRPDTTMVILSQVPPGFTRSRLQPPGRLLHYQVETLIFGRAVERALYPERFIVGCADPTAPLPGAYAQYLERFNCPILPMRFESAELAKISINCCLVSSISTANTLAEICEKIGADWSEIVPALRLDKRIGQYAYLTPGLGIAGGNLERDLATVCRLGDKTGTDVRVVRSWMANSGHRRFWALRTLHSKVLAHVDDPVITVLGLAYKQDTASTKNSQALSLIENLKPFAVRVFDPAVSAEVVQHPRLHVASTALEACRRADSLVIMTPWKEFSELDPSALAETLSGKTVIDPYGMLNRARCEAEGLEYFTLGLEGR
jgi:UDPglucose 6-dehydrogenase